MIWRITLCCLGIVMVDSYPTDCEEMKTKPGSTDDGEYCILIRNKLVAIYCHNMSSTTPGNYVTLRSGPDWNKSEYRNTNPTSPLPDDRTVFSKIALNVVTLEIIKDDFTFSTSSEISVRQNYGTARSCQWEPYVADATMSINLSGTPFYIAESVVFREYGWVQSGYDIAVDLTISSDRKEVTCSVGADCGWCRPEDGKIILDVEGPSVVYPPLVTERIVCSLYCNKHSDCKSFFFSAAPSECILLTALSDCGTGHILEGYQYYQKSCETTLGIRNCLFTNI